MRLTLFALLLLGTLQQVTAQRIFAKKAIQNESMNHFVDASDSYKGLYKRGSREAGLQAARNLYKARRYEEALGLYEYADSLGIITDAEEVFRYFECLKSVKRYQDADMLVKSRLNDYQDHPEFGLNADRLDYYNQLTSFKGAELSRLDLNTKFSDISPTVYDGWLYYVSTKPATGNHKVHRINMQPFYNLYAIPLNGAMKESVTPAGKFGASESTIRLGDQVGRSLPNEINTDYHDGPIQVASSGKILFFTTNHADQPRPKEKKGFVNLRIYWSEKQGDVWSTPQGIPSNSFEYSNQHGYYDEATATLYFASNRPGGKGGYDIWKMKRNSDGSWTDAENLGDQVNTPKTEVFPSLTPDGQLLFASNGWPGLGGLDIFLSDQRSKQPLNLLAGINSEKDDFGLYFKDRNSGYLSSNRAGSVGDDDIWQFKMEWDVKTVRKYNTAFGPVKVIATDGATGKAIAVQIASDTEAVPKTTTISSEGSVVELTEGETLTVSSEGYAPATVKVTEPMVRSGDLSTTLNALPNYQEGEVLVGLKDPQSGSAVSGTYRNVGNGDGTPPSSALSFGQLPQEGAKLQVKSGDRLEFYVPGYEPATMVVTEATIKSGNVTPALVKARPTDAAIMVTSTDPVTGKGVAGMVKIIKAGKEYERTLPAEGAQLQLSAGDKVVLMATGYASKELTVSKTDIRKGSMKAGMQPVKSEISLAGGGITNGKTVGGDPPAQGGVGEKATSFSSTSGSASDNQSVQPAVRVSGNAAAGEEALLPVIGSDGEIASAIRSGAGLPTDMTNAPGVQVLAGGLEQIRREQTGYTEALANATGSEVNAAIGNSSYDETMPFLYEGMNGFLTTKPVSGTGSEGKREAGSEATAYHMAGFSADGKVEWASGSFGPAANTAGAFASLPAGITGKGYSGPVSVSSGGQWMVISDRKGDLLWSRLAANVWSAPSVFTYKGAAADAKSTYRDGYFDENSSTLYFSSNKPGGFGGYDIWKSKWNGVDWSAPQNAGPMVNSGGNEITPFVTANGELMYSSDGWSGLGGQDVYIWKPGMTGPANMLKGVNSASDDVGARLYDQGGYFSSNRPGGKGGYDVYGFKADIEKAIASNKVLGSTGSTQVVADEGIIASGTVVGILSPTGDGSAWLDHEIAEPANSAVYSAYRIIDGRLVTRKRVDRRDNALRKVAVRSRDSRGKVVSRVVSVWSPTPQKSSDTWLTLYFASGRIGYRKSSFADANRVAQMLRSDPSLKIQIDVYTDCVGSEAGNQAMSERRADWLKGHFTKRVPGSEGRIESEGHGETNPVSDCSCEPGQSICSRKQNNLNRRAELRLLR